MLYNLHIQEYCFYCLIADLNNSKVVNILICEGIMSHIFGPTNLILSRPHFIIFTYKFLSLYQVSCLQGKISLIALLMNQHKPCLFQQQALSSFRAIFFQEFLKRRFSKRVIRLPLMKNKSHRKMLNNICAKIVP